MDIKKFVYVSIALGALALSAAPSQAGLVLTLQTGTTTKTIVDNGVGDTDPLLGWITASTTIGAFSTDIFHAGTTGNSNSPGIAGDPATIDLSASYGLLSGRSGVPATLTITLEDTGWTTPIGPGSVQTDVGGTLNQNATASFTSYYNGAVLSHLGTYTTPILTGSAFSGTDSVGQTAVAPYGLKEVAVVTLMGGKAGTSSFDMSTTLVPEPSLIGLLGLGLLGLSGLGWRRNAAKI